jgi:fatty acid desaturase
MMTDIATQTESSSSAIIKLWQRVPLAVRALVTGYVVFAIAGTAAWMAVLALVPIPWSLPVMWLVLFFYLKYFSGSCRDQG